MFAPLFYRHNHMMDQLRKMFEETRQGDYEISTWPLTNIFDNGENLILTAQIPGIKKEDLEINIVKDVLTLSGERKIEYPQDVHIHRRERSNVRFSRSYNLPYRVDASKVDAELADGVLKVILPKHPEEQPKRISITAK